MAVSTATLTTHLKAIMPKGYDTTAAPFTTWITEAIAEMVALAAPEFRERAWVDCLGDGTTVRYALPGFDVALLAINQWTYPHSINTAGVAAPATAPTLALRTGGSLIPKGTTIFGGYAWVANSGETQLSPLSSVTTTAANQTVDMTVPASAVGVTQAQLYTTVNALNPQYTGRASTNVTVSSTATTTTTGLGLGASTVATLPLLDYVDPSTVALAEGSVADGVVDLEFNEDVSGRAATDLTAAGVQTVVMLDSALASGQWLRVWYHRAPQLPASSTTALLGIPDDFAYNAATAFMHRYLALNHETTAKDQHWAAYLDLHNQALSTKSNAAARPSTDVRMMQWSNQTI